jgi:imidazole glycerol phosphate synthase glutamine amidotransferase subunit
MIAIFDYGAGNLRSVENTLSEIGCEYSLIRDSEGLSAATKVVLPGVGHFGQMMRALDGLGVRSTICERIAAGVPYLGICLGLQALFEESEEAPEVRGLGIFPGTVRRFPLDARVPHMGWNQAGAAYYYFAHSYYVPENEMAVEVATYHDIRFTAVLRHKNVLGVQFHPEKSSTAGLKVVRQFVESPV